MHLGISSYTYPWAVGVPGHRPARPLTVWDLLERAAALRVRCLQVADNLPVDRLPEAAQRKLREQAGQQGVSLEVGTRGIGTEHLRSYLRLAATLGAPLLRVVVDTPDHRPEPDGVVALLGAILPVAAEAGITIAIENHDRFRVGTLAAIVRRLDSPYAGICLDTANSLGALEGPEAVVRALAPLTVNLHLKDFVIRRQPHQLGFTVEGRPAGQGQLDIPWLLREVRAAGREPNAILELWTPPAATLEETVRTEEVWAQESITYLRELLTV